MKTEFLKIKLKHLAEEARIIRHKEKKLRGPNWGASSNLFREHRVNVVRVEARHSHIIYGYLRGLDYKQIESNPKTKPSMKDLNRILNAFTYSRSKKEGLENWLSSTKEDLKAA